jgi:quinol monooxygenase YgiN
VQIGAAHSVARRMDGTRSMFSTEACSGMEGEMIIVSGRIYTKAGQRDAFVESSRAAVIAARSAAGCRDFVVAADPVDADRVNVYEEWDSEEELEAFRGNGPSSELTEVITRAVVQRHEIASSGPG